MYESLATLLKVFVMRCFGPGFFAVRVLFVEST